MAIQTATTQSEAQNQRPRSHYSPALLNSTQKLRKKFGQPLNGGPQATVLQTGQMTGSRVCSEENERCTATTRRRDAPWGASMQTSTSRAERVASPAEQRGKNSLSSPMMRGRLHLLAAPASSAGKKMQMTLSCTHNGRHTIHNGNRILSHHTPQSMCTVSVSFPPFPLPENSLMAVAHSPTCQKSLVFLLPLCTSHGSTAKRMSFLLSRILFTQPHATALHPALLMLPSSG
ncbi:hypothetical protein TcG_08693 [Trypanosoma cruzi]|nr:hypothetical protein TcG_08693 [Trypanosoma cruzi]